MIQKAEKEKMPQSHNEPYKVVVKRMYDLYDGNITEQEANEAAHNLIGFCKLLLEIKARLAQNQVHE